MKYGALTLAWAVAATTFVTACDRNEADELAKAQREAQAEIARIQRDADQKIAEARREAAEKIAEAQREAQKERTDATADLLKEQRDLEVALQNAQQETKEQYQEYAKKKMRLMELKAAELKAKASNVGPTVRSDIDQQLQQLEAKEKTIRGSFKELDKATRDTWTSVKAKIDTEFNEFDKSVDALGQKM